MRDRDTEENIDRCIGTHGSETEAVKHKVSGQTDRL